MKRSLYILLVLALVGCAQSKQAYINNFKSNCTKGYICKDAYQGNFQYSLTVLPQILKQEYTEGSKKHLTTKNPTRLFFKLDISLESALQSGKEFFHLESESMDFDQRIIYYTQRFSKDMTILINGNRCPIQNYFFEQNFNLSPISKVLFEVPLPDQKKINNISLELINSPYSNDTLTIELDGSNINFYQRKLRL